MTCKEVKLQIAPHILGEANLTASERGGLEDHLLVCSTCKEEYRETERVIRLVQGMADDCLLQTLGSSQDTGLAEPSPIYTPRRTVAEGWAELKMRIERLPETHQRRRRARMLRICRRSGALAACVVIAVLASVWFSRPGDSPGTLNMAGTGGDRLTATVMGVVTALDADGVEGRSRPLVAGERLAPELGQGLRLRIWDRHEIRAGLGTRLAVSLGSDGGCVVALAYGHIMASVDRAVGEGLFRVVTPQASVTVTGTVFSVMATTDRTDVAVTEGTIEASARTGDTRLVYAGQSFTTDGTAFTPSDGPNVLLAAVEFVKDPVALIQQSSWYQQRFAPLLHLRDYAIKHGVEVDEPTLLALSADLWSLQYPKDSAATPDPYIHRRAGLQRAALFYGYQVEWLTPGNVDEAVEAAAKAVARDELVLAFGRNENAVTVVDELQARQLAASPAWQFRFLGDPVTTPFALCRIAKATHSTRPRQDLARQALIDRHQLLSQTDDREYFVGQSAARNWAHAAARGVELPLNDPMLMHVNAIAILAPSSHERFAVLGAPVDLLRWQSLSGRLQKVARSMLSPAPFNAAVCKPEHEIRLNRLMTDLAAAARDAAPANR